VHLTAETNIGWAITFITLQRGNSVYFYFLDCRVWVCNETRRAKKIAEQSCPTRA